MVAIRRLPVFFSRLVRKRRHFFIIPLYIALFLLVNIIFVSSIGWYATTSSIDSVYIIGGYIGGGTYLSTIAQFKNDVWKKAGDLVIARESWCPCIFR